MPSQDAPALLGAKKDSHHRLEAQRTTSGLVLVVAFRVPHYLTVKVTSGLVLEQAGQRMNVSAEAEPLKLGHAPFQCQVQLLSLLTGVFQNHIGFSC